VVNPLLLVSEDSVLRQLAAQELSPGFELLLASRFSEALQRLEVGPSAVLVDLSLPDSDGVAGFLASLIERGFPGPRILLSPRLRPEDASSFSRSCLVHFALSTPWASGALRDAVRGSLGLW